MIIATVLSPVPLRGARLLISITDDLPSQYHAVALGVTPPGGPTPHGLATDGNPRAAAARAVAALFPGVGLLRRAEVGAAVSPALVALASSPAVQAHWSSRQLSLFGRPGGRVALGPADSCCSLDLPATPTHGDIGNSALAVLRSLSEWSGRWAPPRRHPAREMWEDRELYVRDAVGRVVDAIVAARCDGVDDDEPAVPPVLRALDVLREDAQRLDDLAGWLAQAPPWRCDPPGYTQRMVSPWL